MNTLWQLPGKPLYHRYTLLTILFLGGPLMGLMYNTADQATNWPRLGIFLGLGLVGVWVNKCRKTVLRAIALHDTGDAVFTAMGSETSIPVANLEGATLTTRPLKGVVLLDVAYKAEGVSKHATFRLAVPYFSKDGGQELVDALGKLGLGEEKVVRKTSWAPLI